jgi:very-short-patch-repair endonuclease
MKSLTEARFAKLLDLQRIRWQYEPRTFEYEADGKIKHYKPDFYLPDRKLWVEVKGYLSDRARRKVELAAAQNGILVLFWVG